MDPRQFNPLSAGLLIPCRGYDVEVVSGDRSDEGAADGRDVHGRPACNLLLSVLGLEVPLHLVEHRRGDWVVLDFEGQRDALVGEAGTSTATVNVGRHIWLRVVRVAENWQVVVHHEVDRRDVDPAAEHVGRLCAQESRESERRQSARMETERQDGGQSVRPGGGS